VSSWHSYELTELTPERIFSSLSISYFLTQPALTQNTERFLEKVLYELDKYSSLTDEEFVK
jgi:hypothetical protein